MFGDDQTCKQNYANLGTQSGVLVPPSLHYMRNKDFPDVAAATRPKNSVSFFLGCMAERPVMTNVLERGDMQDNYKVRIRMSLVLSWRQTQMLQTHVSRVSNHKRPKTPNRSVIGAKTSAFHCIVCGSQTRMKNDI